MTKTGLVIFVGFVSLAYGVPATVGREGVSKQYVSTPIRVLLERGRRDAVLQSERDRLFVNYGAGWSQLGNSVRIAITAEKSGPSLSIDGRKIGSRQAYF